MNNVAAMIAIFIPSKYTISEGKIALLKKYITRKMNYKNFITIIRQICKYHHFAFASNIKYDKSSYEITYNIYFNSDL